METIDVHTHFYDPTRPQGVKWPTPNETRLYRPVLPNEFKSLAIPLQIIGTVVVEASPDVSDNQWLLDLADRDPFLLGIVGYLQPGREGFAESLKRYSRHPKFRGARIGGWGTPLEGRKTRFADDLRQLADRSLAMDVNVGADQLPLVASLAEAIPHLTIIINHCAGVRIDGQTPPISWRSGIRECAAHPNVAMKISGLVEQTQLPSESVVGDDRLYQPVLDEIWQTFGENRVVFGSNWPVSAPFASLARVHQLVAEDARRRGRIAERKVLHDNARRIYHLA